MPRKHSHSRRAHASWVTTLARSNQWLMLLFLALIALVAFALWQQHEQTDVKGASTVNASASGSLNSGQKTCVILKRFAVANTCGTDTYKNAVYQCATGEPITVGGGTSCKPISSWAALALTNCKSKTLCESATPSATLTPKPTCIPRPKCLDASPRCLIAEPRNGWCPKTTATPTATKTPTPTPHS